MDDVIMSLRFSRKSQNATWRSSSHSSDAVEMCSSGVEHMFNLPPTAMRLHVCLRDDSTFGTRRAVLDEFGYDNTKTTASHNVERAASLMIGPHDIHLPISVRRALFLLRPGKKRFYVEVWYCERGSKEFCLAQPKKR